jgi:hypothetical protein
MAPQASAPTTPALSGKILFCAGSFREIRTKRNATWRWHIGSAVPPELARGDGRGKTPISRTPFQVAREIDR